MWSFGEGILPQLIFVFCDSQYIDQNNYVETLKAAAGDFYLYKNEMLDEITDAELLEFMKEQFETVLTSEIWITWKVHALTFFHRPFGQGTWNTGIRTAEVSSIKWTLLSDGIRMFSAGAG